MCVSWFCDVFFFGVGHALIVPIIKICGFPHINVLLERLI
jgi:hypothetical protein